MDSTFLCAFICLQFIYLFFSFHMMFYFPVWVGFFNNGRLFFEKELSIRKVESGRGYGQSWGRERLSLKYI